MNLKRSKTMKDPSPDLENEPDLTTPTGIARRAEQIYREKYRAEYENKHPGWYVVVNVRSGEAYVKPSSGEAIIAAREAESDGLFHLMRVGAGAAFRSTRRGAVRHSAGLPA